MSGTKKRGHGAGSIAALTLTVVLGAAMLLSLAAGASVYRRVAGRVQTAAAGRVGLSYITAKIHGFDTAGAVRAGSFGGEDAVFLSQEIDGTAYDTILYVHNGALMELFCEQGAALGPEDGLTVTAARELAVTEAAENLLRLTYTDEHGETQTAEIYLRSRG